MPRNPVQAPQAPRTFRPGSTRNAWATDSHGDIVRPQDRVWCEGHEWILTHVRPGGAVVIRRRDDGGILRTFERNPRDCSLSGSQSGAIPDQAETPDNFSPGTNRRAFALDNNGTIVRPGDIVICQAYVGAEWTLTTVQSAGMVELRRPDPRNNGGIQWITQHPRDVQYVRAPEDSSFGVTNDLLALFDTVDTIRKTPKNGVVQSSYATSPIILGIVKEDTWTKE